MTRFTHPTPEDPRPDSEASPEATPPGLTPGLTPAPSWPPARHGGELLLEAGWGFGVPHESLGRLNATLERASRQYVAALGGLVHSASRAAAHYPYATTASSLPVSPVPVDGLRPRGPDEDGEAGPAQPGVREQVASAQAEVERLDQISAWLRAHCRGLGAHHPRAWPLSEPLELAVAQAQLGLSAACLAPSTETVRRSLNDAFVLMYSHGTAAREHLERGPLDPPQDPAPPSALLQGGGTHHCHLRAHPALLLRLSAEYDALLSTLTAPETEGLLPGQAGYNPDQGKVGKEEELLKVAALHAAARVMTEADRWIRRERRLGPEGPLEALRAGELEGLLEACAAAGAQVLHRWGWLNTAGQGRQGYHRVYSAMMGEFIRWAPVPLVGLLTARLQVRLLLLRLDLPQDDLPLPDLGPVCPSVQWRPGERETHVGEPTGLGLPEPDGAPGPQALIAALRRHSASGMWGHEQVEGATQALAELKTLLNSHQGKLQDLLSPAPVAWEALQYATRLAAPGDVHAAQEPGQQEPGQQEPGQQEPGQQEPGQQEPGQQEPR